jgi:adenine specific DNA methylase Mod
LLIKNFETTKSIKIKKLHNAAFYIYIYLKADKPIIRLNPLKTNQYGTGKVLPTSNELLILLKTWKKIVGD